MCAEWEKKMTPLHFAIALGRVDMVRLLLAHGAKADTMVWRPHLCACVRALGACCVMCVCVWCTREFFPCSQSTGGRAP